MITKLLHISPIELAIIAIRQCYDSMSNSDSRNEVLKDYSTPENVSKSMYSHFNPKFVVGEKDLALMNRIIESGHTSTLEHINVTFQIEGWSRLLLQELARHRIASYSIKSTRYTLKELKAEESFNVNVGSNVWERAKKYINLSGSRLVDQMSLHALENLRLVIESNIANDVTKYCLPDCYKFDGVITMNIRSLRNFLALRTSPKAHFEIRKLAYQMYEQLPIEYRFMVDGCVYKEEI